MPSIRRGLTFLLLVATQSCAALHAQRTYKITSVSMAPLLEPGDVILIREGAFDKSTPMPGEVVALTPPIPGGALNVKRIIAGPGQRVKIRKGVLMIGARVVREPYIAAPTPYDLVVKNYSIYLNGHALATAAANIPPLSDWTSPDTLPKGCYLVLGDNRGFSFDSHLWGCAYSGRAFSTGPRSGELAKPFGLVSLPRRTRGR